MTYKPNIPFTVPMFLFVPETVTAKGSTKKIYPENGILIYCSFRTFGGTEKVVNGVLSVENTAVIETWFRAAVSKEYFVKDNVLRFAFRYFDKDDSGEITFNEIEQLFTQSITDKKNVHDSLKAIIQEVDINNDDKVTFEEFCIIMKKMIK